jgi:membrane-associated protease RseP (regulator of RpoE activity)
MSDQITFTSPLISPQMSMKPTRSTWIKHGLFLFATFVTATLASTLEPFGKLTIFPELIDGTAPDSWLALLFIPQYYTNLIRTSVTFLMLNPQELLYSLGFSISLLFILTAHEAGHYIACRIYRVHATLPFFMPTPPLIGPAGTLGAFIKILSPLPSRKAVFDIGVAGPIAGFVALIPISIIAMLTMDQLPPSQAALHQAQVYFSDPLYMQGMAWLFGIDLQLAIPNAFYYATWMGLLVTALNLIPSGQLDGGHANYAVFGPVIHRWTGRMAFLLMATASVVGFWFYNSPSGFLLAVLWAVMLRVGHPTPLDTEPLDLKRKVIAAATLVIFILCFVPIPIKLAY